MGSPRTKSLVAGLVLGLFYAGGVATVVDPDIWHSMALAREIVRDGAVPWADRFAYTPTVYPVVHHEWLWGLGLYGLVTEGGVAAMQAARAILFTVLAWITVRNARRRGASTPVLVVLAPLAIAMTWMGLTALRAQVATLVCTAFVLGFLETDRRGGRGWILPALALHVLWVNLHGGFVVGMGLFLLHAVEQWWRGRPWHHVVVVVAIMGALTLATPYGVAYPRYLATALPLSRHLIREWLPLTYAPLPAQLIFGASVVAAAIGVRRDTARRTSGWLPLFALTYLAARHERHVSLYALVWLDQVPAVLTATAMGRALEAWWQRRASPATRALAVTALACSLVLVATRRPWALTVPGWRGAGPVAYPVGAVAYLKGQHLARANLLVPFTSGAFVTWKLAPAVKVSIDGRFEAAFAPELLAQHLDFYDARPGWRGFLEDHPTDLVLAPTSAPVVAELESGLAWSIVFRDDTFVLLARPGLQMPLQDLRGSRLLGTLP